MQKATCSRLMCREQAAHLCKGFYWTGSLGPDRNSQAVPTIRSGPRVALTTECSYSVGWHSSAPVAVYQERTLLALLPWAGGDLYVTYNRVPK
jgi:hypothetical protein